MINFQKEVFLPAVTLLSFIASPAFAMDREHLEDEGLQEIKAVLRGHDPCYLQDFEEGKIDRHDAWNYSIRLKIKTGLTEYDPEYVYNALSPTRQEYKAAYEHYDALQIKRQIELLENITDQNQPIHSSDSLGKYKYLPSDPGKKVRIW